MNIPYYYDELNRMRGMQSPHSLNYDSQTFYYFQRSLYQRLISKFNFTVPDHWDKDVFVCELMMLGFVGIFDTNKYAKSTDDMYGIIPEPATLSGIGVQYQPVNIITANQFFYMPEPEVIYKGAGLVRISPDYRGVMDLIDFYAAKFATLAGSIDQAFMNERFSFIAWANTKAGAETLKAIFDKRNSGEPFVVFNKENLKKVDAGAIGEQEPFGFINCDSNKNYISDRLLRDFRTLMNMFDAEIGIPNNPTEKAERMISNEVESNSVETVARFTTWMECLQRSIEKTKKVFPDLKLSVEATRYDTGQTGSKEAGREVSNYGISENNIDRS